MLYGGAARPAIAGAHLVIAGEGPERAALSALADRLGVGGRTHLIGWRNDQAGLLAASDMFVCPSRHEPLGNVVLEAWSATRTVVAAAAQGPSELITQDVDGVLVPVDDARALAGAITALLADAGRAAAFAAAGRAAWAERFAPEPVVARWRHFLATVQA